MDNPQTPDPLQAITPADDALCAQLLQLARDIGTVQSVAQRRTDGDRDHQQMLARLSEWRGTLLLCADVLLARIDAQAQQIAALTAQLGACYREAGADTDGNEDWRNAPYAVDAVKELMALYKEAIHESRSPDGDGPRTDKRGLSSPLVESAACPRLGDAQTRAGSEPADSLSLSAEARSQALEQQLAKITYERDELVTRIPTDRPESGSRLLLNSYGRRCYEAGLKDAEQQLADIENVLDENDVPRADAAENSYSPRGRVQAYINHIALTTQREDEHQAFLQQRHWHTANKERAEAAEARCQALEQQLAVLTRKNETLRNAWQTSEKETP